MELSGSAVNILAKEEAYFFPSLSFFPIFMAFYPSIARFDSMKCRKTKENMENEGKWWEKRKMLKNKKTVFAVLG